MLLQHEKTDDSFKITQTILDFSGSKVYTLEFKFDLSEVKENDGPWEKTTQDDREWFEKYWREKFQ